MIKVDLPDKKYAVIYADPPWTYRQHGTSPKSRGNAAQHYKTMTTDEICRLHVKSIAKKEAVLFLWATFPQIEDAIQVMKAWGLEYKTAAFVWVKTYRSGKLFWGMGAYTRANAEVCLLGVTPDFRAKDKIQSHKVSQIIQEPFAGHSVKPDEARQRIVQLVGDVPRIELFARQRAPGWDAWGDEIKEMEACL